MLIGSEKMKTPVFEKCFTEIERDLLEKGHCGNISLEQAKKLRCAYGGIIGVDFCRKDERNYSDSCGCCEIRYFIEKDF